MISVRYAETDDDVILIHRFLLIVASPTLPGPVDPQKSAIEVWRVCSNAVPAEPSFGLMAFREEILVGTLGIITPTFWWSQEQRFMVNRWFFALPGTDAGKPLLREALRCAKSLGMELQIYDETKGRLTVLNRSKLRVPMCGVNASVFRLKPTATAAGLEPDAKSGSEHQSDADDKAAGVAPGGSAGKY